MKIRENCKRKDKENNNIRRKALNDINEVGHINFQIGNNKTERLKFFFAEVSSGSFFRQLLVRFFGSKKYSEDIRRN